MMKKLFTLLLLEILLLFPLNAAENQDDLKTSKDKMSYAVGVQIGNLLKRQDIAPDYNIMLDGIKEVMDNRPSRFSQDEIKKIMRDYQAEQKKLEAAKLLGDKAWKIQLTKPEMMTFDNNKEYIWVLDTNKGQIRLRLMPDVAPMHVTSTIFLTKKGFYDGITFHRVIPGFMAQAGCPFGTGSGDAGYSYGGEFNPKVKHDRPYLLSTANAGPGTDGSQFFITFTATPGLDGKHTIFGEVVAGQDVVKRLEEGGTQNGTPKEPLIINRATIEEKAKK
ncbi:MAG: peptidylprolyl isomerase [Deltaproteobacteria bacterium]|nr:peptidylprolyl isomerase [Deltaproteobacteria bacterium]